MVVLSQAFVVQSNSTKVLSWLWIAFLLCPFNCQKRGKLVRATFTWHPVKDNMALDTFVAKLCIWISMLHVHPTLHQEK